MIPTMVHARFLVGTLAIYLLIQHNKAMQNIMKERITLLDGTYTL